MIYIHGLTAKICYSSRYLSFTGYQMTFSADIACEIFNRRLCLWGEKLKFLTPNSVPKRLGPVNFSDQSISFGYLANQLFLEGPGLQVSSYFGVLSYSIRNAFAILGNSLHESTSAVVKDAIYVPRLCIVYRLEQLLINSRITVVGEHKISKSR